MTDELFEPMLRRLPEYPHGGLNSKLFIVSELKAIVTCFLPNYNVLGNSILVQEFETCLSIFPVIDAFAP